MKRFHVEQFATHPVVQRMDRFLSWTERLNAIAEEMEQAGVANPEDAAMCAHLDSITEHLACEATRLALLHGPVVQHSPRPINAYIPKGT